MDHRTFTQVEVNGLLAKERKLHEAKLAELRDELGQHTIVTEAANARVAEIEAELAGEREKRTLAERTLAEATAEHRKALNHNAILDALNAADMLPDVAKWAAPEFAAACEFELDAEGRIASATYEGANYPQFGDAARTFIEAHPYFKKAPLGGSGSPRHARGAPAPARRDITKEDPMRLADEGWRAGAEQ